MGLAILFFGISGCHPSRAEPKGPPRAGPDAGDGRIEEQRPNAPTPVALPAAPREVAPLTPLAGAALMGNMTEVRRLLAEGADVNAGGGDGFSPLLAALSPYIGEPRQRRAPGPVPRAEIRRRSNKLLIAQLFIDSGADVNRADGLGRAPLHAAVDFTGEEKALPSVIRALLKRGAQVNARAEGGMTALLFAVDRRREVLARILVNAGADPTLKGPDGRSSIDVAKDRGLAALAGEMEEAKAGLAKNPGPSPGATPK